MLVISQKDIEKINDAKLWVDCMEEALQASNKDFHTPPRMHIDMEEDTLLLMPSMGPDNFSTKLVSVFPSNKLHGKPPIQGNVILFDGKNGDSLALINGAKLTAMRTAAIAVVGIRHLSNENKNNLGIVGAGTQGQHIAMMAAKEKSLDKIYVFDKSEAIIKDFKEFINVACPGLKVISCSDIEELLSLSDLVFLATTSKQPVLPNKAELLEGKVFVGVGSYKPDMQEFPDALFKLVDEVWIDAEHGKKESGDLINPLKKGLIKESSIKQIRELITKPDEYANGQTKIYKTVGEGVFDLFAAKLVYEKANEMNMGVNVEL